MLTNKENPVRRINHVTILNSNAKEDKNAEIQRMMKSFVKGEDVVLFSQGCPNVLNGRNKFLGGNIEPDVVLSATDYLFEALQKEKDDNLRLSEFINMARANPMSNICRNIPVRDMRTTFCCISYVQVYKERIYDLLEPIDGRRYTLSLKKDLCGNVIIHAINKIIYYLPGQEKSLLSECQEACKLFGNLPGETLLGQTNSAKEIPVANFEAVKTNLEFGKLNAKEGCLNYDYSLTDCHYLFVMKLKQANLQTISSCILCDLAHHSQNRRTGDVLFTDASLRAVQKHVDMLCSNALPQIFQDQKFLPMCSRSVLMRLSLKIFHGNGKILIFPCSHTANRNIQFNNFECSKQHIGNPKPQVRKEKMKNNELKAKIDEQEKQLMQKEKTIANLMMQNENIKGAIAVMQHEQDLAKHNLAEMNSTIEKNMEKLNRKDFECEETSSMMEEQLMQKDETIGNLRIENENIKETIAIMQRELAERNSTIVHNIEELRRKDFECEKASSIMNGQIKEKIQFNESLQMHIQHLQELQTLQRQSIADKEALLEKERIEHSQLKKQQFSSEISYKEAMKEKLELIRITTARLRSKEKTVIILQREIGELEGRNVKQATKVPFPYEDDMVMSKRIKTEDWEDDQNFASYSSCSSSQQKFTRFP